MSDPQQEYARALAAYRRVLDRLKRAKAALAASKAKPTPRTYTLAEIDAMFPPSAAMNNKPRSIGNDHV